MRVLRELKELGMRRWGLMKQSTEYLPSLIHDNEHIKAVTYGHNDQGSAMLVATDSRVISIDKKFMYMKEDELTYDIVGGVSLSSVGFDVILTLHSKMGDFQVRTINRRCADRFRDFIESRCVERRLGQVPPTWR